ncbi:MAG: substrate-binding domain-containing protein [Candidatus Thorarchaeota archaeon]|nr:substrate-binding domain-containing protein [Candidatus Thorarchaeota archaeon]
MTDMFSGTYRRGIFVQRETRIAVAAVLVVVILAGTSYYIYWNQNQGRDMLVISTTTSLYDTGLLDVIKERYEQENPNVILAFISAGTGIAITHAKNGDADMILVHSPSQEYSFMNESYGVNRKIFAYNYFTIVGPSSDVAEINQTDPISALQMIYNYGHAHNTSLWITRDDFSGTNSKEISLWGAAGYNYTQLRDEPWFVSSGVGMASTLNIANEQSLYTLSDIGTYVKYKSDELISLDQLVGEGQELLNVYSAIVVNNTTVSFAKFDLAMDFLQWIVGLTAQQLIADYGVADYGQGLFFPVVDMLESESPTQIFGWIREYAFFNDGEDLYECPPGWRFGEYGLYG